MKINLDKLSKEKRQRERKWKHFGGYSLGIPGVVVGVLLALKHIGMTNISYWGILLYGFEIWLCCAVISLAIVFVLFVLNN